MVGGWLTLCVCAGYQQAHPDFFSQMVAIEEDQQQRVRREKEVDSVRRKHPLIDGKLIYGLQSLAPLAPLDTIKLRASAAR